MLRMLLFVLWFSAALELSFAERSESCDGRSGCGDDSITMIQTKMQQLEGSGALDEFVVGPEGVSSEDAGNGTASSRNPKTAQVLDMHGQLQSVDLHDPSSALGFGRGIPLSVIQQKKMLQQTSVIPAHLDSFVKYFDVPSHGWAVAFMVLLSLIVVGASVFGFWMFRRTEQQGKPLCSLAAKVGILVFLGMLTLGAAYLACFYLAGDVLEQLIENFDVAFLGVRVSIEKATLNPFSGELRLDNLEVANPPGYNSDYLLRAKLLRLDFQMLPFVFSLFKRLEIRKVELSGMRTNYEQALTTSNILDVMHHAQKDQDSRSNAGNTSSTVILHEVSMTDCWVKGTLSLTGSRGISLAVPDLHYTDFEEEVGANTTDVIIDVLLGSLLKSILHVVSL